MVETCNNTLKSVERGSKMTVREWAHSLVLKMRSKSAHVFTLTGNVNDLVARARVNERDEYYNLSETLTRIFDRHAFVFEYDMASGLRFANEESEKRFREFEKKMRTPVNPVGETNEVPPTDGVDATGELRLRPRRPTAATELRIERINPLLPAHVRDGRINNTLPTELREVYANLPEGEKNQLRQLTDVEIVERLMARQLTQVNNGEVQEENGEAALPQRIDHVFAFLRECVFSIKMEKIIEHLEEARNGQIEAPAAVIIHGTEFVFTGGSDHRLSDVEQSILGNLVGIAGNSKIGKEGSVLVLAAKNEATLPAALTDPAYGFCKIEIPYPDQGQREHFLSVLTSRIDANVPGLRLFGGGEREQVYVLPEGMTIESFSRGPTSGMRLLDIENVARDIAATPRDDGQELVSPVLSVEALWDRKKDYLKSASRGRIEPVNPVMCFDWIGGHDEIKQYLKAVAEAVLRGDTARIPKGILLQGPPGTGKSVLCEATAQMSGISMVGVRNQMDMWLGNSTKHQTIDTNLLMAFAPVVVRQDEADGKQYNRNDQYQGDGGVSAEMGSNHLEFMGDESRRGKVIWIAISNRPDIFDEAMIRPGRFDRIVPILPPTNPEDWAKVAKAIVRKMVAQYEEFKWSVSDDNLLEIVSKLPRGSTQSHLNEFFYRAYYFAKDGNIGPDELRQGINDYRPMENSQFDRQIELALEYSNSEELVPAAWRGYKAKVKKAVKSDAVYPMDAAGSAIPGGEEGPLPFKKTG